MAIRAGIAGVAFVAFGAALIDLFAGAALIRRKLRDSAKVAAITTTRQTGVDLFLEEAARASTNY